MTISFIRPPQQEGTPQPTEDEVAWRRELKQLRVRVAQLEAEHKSRLAPSIEHRRDSNHDIKCGTPCGVIVFDKVPRVECEACGTPLDPIEVLRDYAHHERNFCFGLEHLRKEENDLKKEIKKLQALRLRLRAEARKLLPEPPVDPQWNRKYDRATIANAQLDHVLASEKIVDEDE